MTLRVPAVASVPALLAVGGGACVIPPPLEIGERDAGTNFTPKIVSAGPADFTFPGPLTLDRNDARRFRITIEDPDLDDTLHARFFVDYVTEAPSPNRGSCSAPPSGELSRIADCSAAAICTAITEGDTDRHLLEVMVADREFLLEGEPLFRALPSGARYTIRSWLFTCTDTNAM